MSPKVIVSAPGKSILMGEHAVVYGQPALVAAVDMRLRVEMEPWGRDEIAVDVPILGLRSQLSWPEVLDYAERTRERWLEYRANPGPETFVRVRGEKPDHLIQVALGEAALFLRRHASQCGSAGDLPEIPGGLRLSVHSEIPLGAGFGSSAAAASTLVMAFLLLMGHQPSKTELSSLALEVERRQHGQPSGVDTETVLCGGVLEARLERGQLVTTPVNFRDASLGAFRLFNTGTPAESTGEVVAAVRVRGENRPTEFQRLLRKMGRVTTAFAESLASSAPNREGLRAQIREFQACLELLGVVPEAVREKVRQVEEAGGAAKISGAGALSGEAAGCLLVYHPQPSRLEGLGALGDLRPLPSRFGAEGLRSESP